MRLRVRLVAALLTVAAASGLAACGGSAEASPVKTLRISALPGTLLDLNVQPETARIKALRGVKRPFVDGVALFSLRRDSLLEATLQVSRFNKSAKMKSVRFRNSIVNQIGSSEPHLFRMGDDDVYLTTGRRQAVNVWFKGRYLFILSIRDEYPQPRLLLRTALEVNP